MKLIFERSAEGRRCCSPAQSDVPAWEVPEAFRREERVDLPEVSETELSRHYTALAKQVYGVNDGFYPLGSCTMKYNPAVNEETAALPGFRRVHPLQGAEESQGCLEVLWECERMLREVTGMDAMTFQPAAGAHGELTGGQPADEGAGSRFRPRDQSRHGGDVRIRGGQHSLQSRGRRGSGSAEAGGGGGYRRTDVDQSQYPGDF